MCDGIMNISCVCYNKHDVQLDKHVNMVVFIVKTVKGGFDVAHYARYMVHGAKPKFNCGKG